MAPVLELVYGAANMHARQIITESVVEVPVDTHLKPLHGVHGTQQAVIFSTLGVLRIIQSQHTLTSRRNILSKVSRLDVPQVKASASLAWVVPQTRKEWAALERAQEVALRVQQVSINQMQETGRVFLVSHAMPTHIIRLVVRVHLVRQIRIKLEPHMLHPALHAEIVQKGRVGNIAVNAMLMVIYRPAVPGPVMDAQPIIIKTGLA